MREEFCKRAIGIGNELAIPDVPSSSSCSELRSPPSRLNNRRAPQLRAGRRRFRTLRHCSRDTFFSRDRKKRSWKMRLERVRFKLPTQFIPSSPPFFALFIFHFFFIFSFYTRLERVSSFEIFFPRWYMLYLSQSCTLQFVTSLHSVASSRVEIRVIHRGRANGARTWNSHRHAKWNLW